MSDILRRSSYAAGYNTNSIQSDSFPTPTPTSTPRRQPSVENNYHDRLESSSSISLPITPSPTKLRVFLDRLIEKIQVVMPNPSRKHSAPSLRDLPTPTPTPLQVNNQDQVGRDQETVREQDKDYTDSLSLPTEKKVALDKEEREKAAKSVLKEIVGIDIKKGHINKEVTLMLKALETAYDDSKSPLEKSSAIV